MQRRPDPHLWLLRLESLGLILPDPPLPPAQHQLHLTSILTRSGHRFRPSVPALMEAVIHTATPQQLVPSRDIFRLTSRHPSRERTTLHINQHPEPVLSSLSTSVIQIGLHV